jgi:hypothetical protein
MAARSNFVQPDICMIGMTIIIIIIISPLQFTAGQKPLQLLVISIFGYSNPAPASRPAQIVTPSGLKVSYTTFTETWSPL